MSVNKLKDTTTKNQHKTIKPRSGYFVQHLAWK